MKKNKGITLVALVVTIVVLLILAGVSINLVLEITE
ncbi:MAG: prepilin-type N-terminal cleavage/methylation domain-containing protein [Clostridia bacterium]